MTEPQLEKLKYPIGKPNEYSSRNDRTYCIDQIARLPKELSKLVTDLSVEQLQFPYRPDGWNIKQVVHHLVDSHMNSLIRYKLTLTEDEPIIKPYHEQKWALLTDGLDDNLTDSLQLLSSLHKKWVRLLKSMTDEQFGLNYVHPAKGKKVSLHTNTGLYAWHGEHHLAHIRQALRHKGDFKNKVV